MLLYTATNPFGYRLKKKKRILQVVLWRLILTLLRKVSDWDLRTELTSTSNQVLEENDYEWTAEEGGNG